MSQSGENLWAVAAKSLGPEIEQQLQIYQADKTTDVDRVLQAVKSKQDLCMRKRWKFKSRSGNEVIIRDLFDKIALWIQRFKEIGDVFIQYDPAHAALTWAGVRLILQVSIHDIETFGAVSEGLEMVSRFITRYAIFERVYLPGLPNSGTTARLGLSEALVSVYGSCLKFLAICGTYYQQSTAKRITRSLFKSSRYINEAIGEIQRRELEVEKFASVVHTELSLKLDTSIVSLKQETSTGFQALERLIQSLEQPILRLRSPLDEFRDARDLEERRRMLRWLSTVPCREHHASSYGDVLPGTGNWLFRKPEYQKWHHSSDSSILWLHGIPGCGKSKLCSIIIQQLQDIVSRNPDSAPVAYFYCSKTKGAASTTDAVVVLRTILKQLASSQSGDQVRWPLWEEYNQRKEDADKDGLEPTSLTMGDCADLILALNIDCPMTIIIDGLDEADGNRRDLLDSLHTIIEGSSNVVKVLISSLDESDIAQSLEKHLSIRISPIDNASDIDTFVSNIVASSITNRQLLNGKVSMKIQEHIIRTLIENSGGMFLWAALQMQHLCNRERFKCEADIMSALKGLPPTLVGIFDELYDRINNYECNSRKLVKHVFSWLLAAQRPLSIAEVIDAVTEGRLMSYRDSSSARDMIVDICCPFVVLDHDQRTFTFAHASVAEYLNQLSEYGVSQINFLAVRRCLKSLIGEGGDLEWLSKNISDESISENGIMETELQIENIHTYAACYWVYHYSAVTHETLKTELELHLREFIFSDEGIYFHQWLLNVQQLTQFESVPLSFLKRLVAAVNDARSPIFLAAAYDISFIVEYGRTKAPARDYNAANSHGTCAIYVAAYYGNLNVLQVLLEYGASLDISGGHFGTPLQAAAFQGHVDVVKFLLEQKADPLVSGKFDNALDAAIAGGREAVINLLLRYDGLIDNVSKLSEVLLKASYNGHYSVVDHLLKRLASNQPIQSDRTSFHASDVDALQVALYRGRARVAQSLLSDLPEIDGQGGHFGNALQAAAFGGHAAMVIMVLNRGADVGSSGRYGSALRAASLGGHDAVVRILIDHNDALDNVFSDALQAAAFNGHLSTLQLLLDSGLCEKYKCSLTSTIEAASLRGHIDVVRVLLKICDTDDAKIALLAALKGGQERIVELILGLLPDLRDLDIGYSVRCLLRSRRNLLPIDDSKMPSEEAATTSVPFRKDVRLTDELHWNTDASKDPLVPQSRPHSRFSSLSGAKGDVLRFAIQLNNPNILANLLDRGIDSGLESPLDFAAVGGYWQTAQVLLDRGIALGNALHLAVRHGQEEFVRSLVRELPGIEVDISVDEETYSANPAYTSRSALALAVAWDRKQIFDILLSHNRASARRGPGLAMIFAARSGKVAFFRSIVQSSKLLVDLGKGDKCPRSFTILQAAREAAANRHVEILHILLSDPRLKAMQMFILTEAVRKGIRSGWYEIMRHLRSIIPPIRYEHLAGTALIAFSTRKIGENSQVEATQGDGLLEDLNSLSKTSKTLVRYYPKALRAAVTARNTRMAHFILLKDETGRHLRQQRDLLRVTIIGNPNPGDLSKAAGESKDLPEIIRLLISHGANVNDVDDEAKTALYYACTLGYSETFKILLAAGADPFTLHEPISSEKLGFEDIIPTLAELPSKANLLQIALDARYAGEGDPAGPAFWEARAQKGWGEIIMSCLDLGITVHTEQPSLCRFFNICCYQGNLDYVERLFSKNVSFTANPGRRYWRDHNFRTALHAAVIGGHEEVVAFLIKHDADPRIKREIPDRGGMVWLTPVGTVVEGVPLDGEAARDWKRNKSVAVSELLVEAGAAEEDGVMLLNAAIEEGNGDMVRRLLRRGLKPSKVLCDHLEIIKDLAENHADCLDIDLLQEHAISKGNIPLLEYLFTKYGWQIPMGDFSRIALGVIGECRLEILRFIVQESGFDVNRIYPVNHDETRNTNLLQQACQEQYSDSFRFLPKESAYLNCLELPSSDLFEVADSTSNRPSYEILNPTTVVKALLDHGADPHCPGLPSSALFEVVKSAPNRRYHEMDKLATVVKALLDHGADVHHTRKMVGLTINDKDPGQAIPILLYAVYAADKGLDLVNLLVKHGVDTNEGFISPLRLARQLGAHTVAELLSRHGAVEVEGRAYTLREIELELYPEGRVSSEDEVNSGLNLSGEDSEP